MLPKISVIIPVFNSEATIERAVMSVADQSVKDIEILVCDDCSTDNSFDILKALSDDDPRIKLTRNAINRGAGLTRDTLLKQATGEYFAFLDSDDYWLPGKLDAQLNLMNQKALDICFTQYRIVDEAGTILGERSAPTEITFKKMLASNWIPTSAAILRSDLLGARDMPALRRRQDYGYWLHLFSKNLNLRCEQLSDIMVVYLRRKESLSSNKIQNVVFNYKMFREVCGYNRMYVVLLIIINAIIRLRRV